jgi:hypothetical protein
VRTRRTTSAQPDTTDILPVPASTAGIRPAMLSTKVAP